MVQLTMRMHPDGRREMFIVELQGDLETKSEMSSLSGKFIGDMHFTDKGEAIIVIGHHILHGKVAKLEKPLAILERSEEEEMDMENDDGGCGGKELDRADFMVKAIIRKKLIFKTRPKPIIANVPKKL